jgi:hypothetical protein
LTWPRLATDARPRASASVEEGTSLLQKFEQPIGEEKYSVQQDGDELQLSVTFHFNDRGTDMPLDAYVLMGRDFVPRSMEIHGDVARCTPIDDTVFVDQAGILMRNGNEQHASERPSEFFTFAAYAPAALQMMLIRKWQAAGRPKKLQTFPAGELSNRWSAHPNQGRGRLDHRWRRIHLLARQDRVLVAGGLTKRPQGAGRGTGVEADQSKCGRSVTLLEWVRSHDACRLMRLGEGAGAEHG